MTKSDTTVPTVNVFCCSGEGYLANQ